MIITDQLTQNFLLEVPAAVAVLRGPNFVYELANEEYLSLVGKTASDLIGREGREALPELEAQGIWKIFDQVYETGKTFIAKEFSANIDRNHDGILSPGFYSFVAKAIIQNGETIGILIHADEVTELVTIKEAVEASEEQLQAFVDHIPVLAWIAQPDGYIYWYNKAWYDYTGTAPEDMEGWGWKKVHSPEFVDNVVTRWQSSVDTGLPFEMTFPLMGADGKYHNFMTRVSPYKGSSGKIEKWFGTNTRID